MCSSRYRLALIVGCLVRVFDCLDGHFALILFSTTIFKVISGKSERYAIIATVCLGPADLVGILLYAFLSDRIIVSHLIL